MPIAITNKTKSRPPRLPFSLIKDAVLGEKYDLSLVFIGSARSRVLNKNYRGKDKPTNILSFPLSDAEGEIFIDLSRAKKEAPDFQKNYSKFVGLLFIHGLFHLKGLRHGSTMEKKEAGIRKKFDI